MAECMEDRIIIDILKDAGCDDAVIQRFLRYGLEQKKQEQLRLLRRHRCNLLDAVHQNQKRIDCLDYLVYKMK